jgi:hypothetical protein
LLGSTFELANAGAVFKAAYLINDAAVSLKFMGHCGPLITGNLLLGVFGHLDRRGKLSSLEYTA